MYDFLVSNNVISIIFLALGFSLVVFLFIKQMRRMGLEEIRDIVYQGFIVAENEFKYGDNKEKFEYVVKLARDSVPSVFKLFITEKVLRDVIQAWFDLCKDLLDDGKLNKSVK